MFIRKSSMVWVKPNHKLTWELSNCTFWEIYPSGIHIKLWELPKVNKRKHKFGTHLPYPNKLDLSISTGTDLIPHFLLIYSYFSSSIHIIFTSPMIGDRLYAIEEIYMVPDHVLQVPNPNFSLRRNMFLYEWIANKFNL